MRISLLTVLFAFLLLGSLSACGMGTEMTKDEFKEFSNSDRSAVEHNGGVYEGNGDKDWMMDKNEPRNPFHKNAPNDKNHTSDEAKYSDEWIRIK